jgi:hypothetical protein
VRNGYLDGAVDVAASVFEDVLERLTAGLGLVGNAASDEVALSIGGNLSGDPDLAGGFNGLRLVRHCQKDITETADLEVVKSAVKSFSVRTYVVCHGYNSIVSNSFGINGITQS